MMVREHTQALHDGRELAKRLDLHPAACPLADEIRQKSGELIRALRERRGRDFDREYVRAQIEEHQGLLRQIDERLRPSSDGDLALYVDDMRGAVQRHLTAAQALQGRVAIR
jgi:predicted outer membrane protein